MREKTKRSEACICRKPTSITDNPLHLSDIFLPPHTLIVFYSFFFLTLFTFHMQKKMRWTYRLWEFCRPSAKVECLFLLHGVKRVCGSSRWMFPPSDSAVCGWLCARSLGDPCGLLLLQDPAEDTNHLEGCDVAFRCCSETPQHTKVKRRQWK